MVDYIAVSEVDAAILEQVAKGLYRGCELAQVSLSGGELAQVAELLSKKEKGISFDIVGTAIGTVSPDRILIGQDLQEGDVLVGFESSGLHSNGYTLARKVCFDVARHTADRFIPELGRTLGEEFLEPTRIYVKEVLEILKQIPVKALFHITGDGLFNLIRTAKPVGYRIEKLPEPPPIFSLIKKAGNIPDEEMFRVFNMGIGFAVVVPDDSTLIEKIKSITRAAGYPAHVLGHVTADPERTILVEPYRISGHNGKFSRV
jgi:phosphoribosylformylglycinamidine cyclo-ligase